MNKETKDEKFAQEQEARYPELRTIAKEISRDTCIAINEKTKDVVSEMPYKAQFVLEEVIQILQSKV